MKVLLVSPHVDDIELGAGGTVIKLLEQKNELLWVVFSTAEDALKKSYPKDVLEKEFVNVVTSLKFKKENYMIFKYKVRRLNEHRQDVLDELINIRNDFYPELVIGPSLHDYHQDHQTVIAEVIRAFKNNASIISFDMPWNHIEFQTQLFYKLEDRHIKKKYSLLMNYKSQLNQYRYYFNKEFIYGWARTRGAQVKTKYAEAFEVIRLIY